MWNHYLMLYKFSEARDNGATAATSSPLQRLSSPVLEMEIKGYNGKFKYLSYVEALPGGGALVTNYMGNRRQVLKVNQLGEVVRILYSCTSCPWITGLLLVGNSVFVLHRNGKIVRIDVNTGNLLVTYRIDVGGLVQAGLLATSNNHDPDVLLLADYRRGEIFTYRLSSREKEVKVTGLRWPTSVSYVSSSGGTAYIVCERGTSMIRTYNATWHPMASIGGQGIHDGQLSRPNAAFVTPEDTVIVADTRNNRVSEFTARGHFVRHIMSGSDNIKHPWALSFSFPYLWLVYESKGIYNIRKYGMYKDILPASTARPTTEKSVTFGTEQRYVITVGITDAPVKHESNHVPSGPVELPDTKLNDTQSTVRPNVSKSKPEAKTNIIKPQITEEVGTFDTEPIINGTLPPITQKVTKPVIVKEKPTDNRNRQVSGGSTKLPILNSTKMPEDATTRLEPERTEELKTTERSILDADVVTEESLLPENGIEIKVTEHSNEAVTTQETIKYTRAVTEGSRLNEDEKRMVTAEKNEAETTQEPLLDTEVVTEGARLNQDGLKKKVTKEKEDKLLTTQESMVDTDTVTQGNLPSETGTKRKVTAKQKNTVPTQNPTPDTEEFTEGPSANKDKNEINGTQEGVEAVTTQKSFPDTDSSTESHLPSKDGKRTTKTLPVTKVPLTELPIQANNGNESEQSQFEAGDRLTTELKATQSEITTQTILEEAVTDSVPEVITEDDATSTSSPSTKISVGSQNEKREKLEPWSGSEKSTGVPSTENPSQSGDHKPDEQNTRGVNTEPPNTTSALDNKGFDFTTQKMLVTSKESKPTTEVESNKELPKQNTSKSIHKSETKSTTDKYGEEVAPTVMPETPKRTTKESKGTLPPTTDMRGNERSASPKEQINTNRSEEQNTEYEDFITKSPVEDSNEVTVSAHTHHVDKTVSKEHNEGPTVSAFLPNNAEGGVTETSVNNDEKTAITTESSQPAIVDTTVLQTSRKTSTTQKIPPQTEPVKEFKSTDSGETFTEIEDSSSEVNNSSQEREQLPSTKQGTFLPGVETTLLKTTTKTGTTLKTPYQTESVKEFKSKDSEETFTEVKDNSNEVNNSSEEDDELPSTEQGTILPEIEQADRRSLTRSTIKDETKLITKSQIQETTVKDSPNNRETTVKEAVTDVPLLETTKSAVSDPATKDSTNARSHSVAHGSTNNKPGTNSTSISPQEKTTKTTTPEATARKIPNVRRKAVTTTKTTQIPKTSTVSTGQFVRLRAPLMDLNLHSVNKALGTLYYMAALPGGQAIVANYISKNNTDQITLVDSNGRTIRSLLKCRNCGGITGLLVIKMSLYILHGNGKITEIVLPSGPLLKTFQVNAGYLMHTGSLSANLVNITDILLLSDYQRGQIFTYSLSTGEKTVRVTGLQTPSSVAYLPTSNGTNYVVCDSIDSIIKVYDENWSLVGNIGGRGRADGQMMHPSSAVTTPDGSILVADYYNNRVSEFDASGRFTRHLLTMRRDRIHKPFALSFSYPYLWVAYYARGNQMKRFKLYETSL